MADHGDSFGTAGAHQAGPGLPPQILTDLLIGFAACMGAGDRNAVYVSTPITTGPLFVDWFPHQADQGTPAYARRLREQIIEPNLRRALPVVRAARERYARHPVIDPTALEDVPGWAQNDYHVFWTRLIDRCAGKVVFAPGWEFSNGCALEFAAACNAGADLYDSEFQPITREHGTALLTGAAVELACLGVDDTVLREAVRLCQPTGALAKGR